MKKLVLTSLLLTGICAVQLGAANTQPETKAVQQKEYGLLNTVSSYTAPLTKFVSDNAEPILSGVSWAAIATGIGGLGYLAYQAGYLTPMAKVAYACFLYSFYKEHPNYSAGRLALEDAFDNE
jgi:hypothetical protein